MSRSVGSEEIEVRAGDGVDRDVRAYVARRIAFCLQRVPADSVKAQVRLTALASDSLERPALVQARLELDGRLVRAQLAATSLDIASQRLGERLTLQLSQWRGAPRPRPWPDRGDLLRPEPVPIQAGRRHIVRRKFYRLEELHPQQAAHEMDLRDYDFHLFIDSDTGQDSLVFRVGPTGYRLTRLGAGRPLSTSGPAPITVDAYPAPSGTPEQIVDRLDATDMRHRFFLDATSDRGAVLYRRFDGHYGLLSPETS